MVYTKYVENIADSKSALPFAQSIIQDNVALRRPHINKTSRFSRSRSLEKQVSSFVYL